jgi:hypothetical protein
MWAVGKEEMVEALVEFPQLAMTLEDGREELVTRRMTLNMMI